MRNILDELYLHLQETGLLDGVIIKGGWLLSRAYKSPRLTTDIDGSMLEMTQQYIDEFTSVVTEFMNHFGISMYKISFIESTGILRLKFDYCSQQYGVDISGKIKYIDCTLYQTQSYVIRGNTLEMIVADKLSAVCSPKVFRRIKDLYDLYFLYNNYEIDIEKLYEILASPNYDLEGILGNYPFYPDNLDGIFHAYDTFKLNRHGTVQTYKPPIDDLMIAIDTIFYRIKARSEQ